MIHLDQLIEFAKGSQKDLIVLDRLAKREVTGIATLDEAGPQSMVWIKGAGHTQKMLLEHTAAGIIVCHADIATSQSGKCVLGVGNPKLLFAFLANHFFVEKPLPGIHPTAFVDPEAEIGSSVSIGPFTYVGKSNIGDETVISGHCHIHNGVIIGKHNIIHAGCVIGDHGSGYARDPEGRFFKFPQIGRVVLGDYVEIGANTYVNRGALGDTEISEGSKIGNSVCIGHNVKIGRHTIVIANSVVAGSCEIGHHTWIAPSCTIRNGTKIGDNVMVGMGSVVTKEVPDGMIVLGNPAEPIENQKNWRSVKRHLIEQNPLLSKWKE